MFIKTDKFTRLDQDPLEYIGVNDVVSQWHRALGWGMSEDRQTEKQTGLA